MQNGDDASPSIILASKSLFFVKMLITLESCDAFGSNFAYLCMLTFSSHWHVKRDEASPKIIFVGRPLLVKMLITFEPHGIFRSNCVYF